jgi:DNA-binding CsgD family transcriptional regulator
VNRQGDDGERLIGRDAELRQIQRALQRLDKGLPTLVEVVAEPGMGKSSLLAELGRQLGGKTVLRARATELEHATPCAVVAKAFESTGLNGSVEATVRQLIGVDAGTVDIPRHESYRTARRTLMELADPAGVAVLLDDVHWADGDSLALLEYLLSTMPAAGVLVAVAYRPRQAPARLVGALDAPEVAAWRERVELGPLNRADSLALLNDEHLVAAGAGNPLYLLALAHAGDAVHANVPDRLRAALLSDVDSASPAARQLARAAAVVGDPFDADVAVEVSGLDRPAATVAIDELHRRDVIRPESAKLLTFRHPLLRRMIYDDAPPGWRRSAHRAAITALRWRGASVMAEAAHVERCAGTGDTDAVEVLLKAADLAGPRAPASAARWLRGAMALVPATVAAAPEWLARHVQLARYLVLAGQFAEAQDVLREVPADLRRTEIVILQATIDRLLGNHNDGRRRLLDELDRNSHPALALELATVELMEGTVSARTIELARQACDSPELRTGAYAVAAVTSFLVGDLDNALDHCDSAVLCLDALPDHELGQQLDACVWTGWTEISLARFLPGLAHFERGVELARHSGQAHLLSHLLVGRAICLRWLGRLPAAAEVADEAVDVARVCRSNELLALAMANRAWIAIFGGDLAAARAQAEAVVRLAGPDTGWWATMAGFVAATAQAEAGSVAAAGRRLLTIGGGAELPRVDPQGRPAWYELLVRAAVADGDRPRAKAWAARATASADDRLPMPSGLAALARAGSVSPDNPSAGRDAQRAVDLFAQAGAPLELARATMVLAQCLAATGRQSAARKLAGQAADIYATCGADRLRDNAQLTSAPSTPLSRRESEVTELVSRGYTNKQIAEELYVTEKTVETHLSRIFTKLSLSSRAALAAWLVASRE